VYIIQQTRQLFTVHYLGCTSKQLECLVSKSIKNSHNISLY